MATDLSAPACPELLFADDVIAPPRVENRTARVLHLINGEHYSGAERVQDLLALRLPEFGFAADFACLKLNRFGACRQAQSAELFDLPMRSRIDLGPAYKVAALVRRNRYRVLHSHTPRAAMIGRVAAALTGVPLVHHVHSPTAVDSTHRWRNRFNTTVERLSLGRVAGVIAVSSSLREYARRQGIDPQVIHVVPNGVPTQGPLADRLAPTGTWTVATVALFRPRKGLEILIEALSFARSEGLPIRLRAVGGFETPEYEAQIRRQVDRLQVGDYIDWTGFTQNVTGELARSDLFVLPSLFGEGLPMVVLEAMAAGVPVVATRVEGIPEAVRDGVDGLIAAPGDPRELAKAIARFVRGEADWRAIRASAHRRQAEKFSDRSMAEGVAEVYRRVLER
jgi:glycosyltransferase involved in cell wall biosynthesis